MPDPVVPIPADAQSVGPMQRKQSGAYELNPDQENLYLAFYRLVPHATDDEHKREYLEAVVKRWTDKIRKRWQSGASPLEAVRARVEDQIETLSESGTPARQVTLETESRLVAGLGYDAPLEVGFTLHPLYGYPYLPGSSVKGVARTYARKGAGASERDLLHVFGSTSKNEEGSEKKRGAVRFMDAVPAGFPELAVDTLTPHYREYYQGDAPPGDWHEPNPVPFLTVERGARFHFPLIADDEDALEQAAEWLRDGLFWLGIGGKTRAGYGIFTDSERRQKRQESREKKKRMEEYSNVDPVAASSIDSGSTDIPVIYAAEGEGEGRALVQVYVQGDDTPICSCVDVPDDDRIQRRTWLAASMKDYGGSIRDSVLQFERVIAYADDLAS